MNHFSPQHLASMSGEIKKIFSGREVFVPERFINIQEDHGGDSNDLCDHVGLPLTKFESEEWPME